MRVRGPESQLDWLAVASLWLGAVLFAIKTADLTLMVGAPTFLTSHFWNVLPAILLSVTLAIFIYRQIFPPAPESSKQSDLAAEAAVETGHPKILPVTGLTQPPSQIDRVYVGQDLTPYTLMDMVKDKTHHEGQRIAAPFIGKWMRVRGKFADLSINEYFASVIMKPGAEAHFGAVSFPDTRSITFYFRGGGERLEILRPGEAITVDGRIKEVDSHTFKLDECVLVSPGRDANSSRLASPLPPS